MHQTGQGATKGNLQDGTDGGEGSPGNYFTCVAFFAMRGLGVDN